MIHAQGIRCPSTQGVKSGKLFITTTECKVVQINGLRLLGDEEGVAILAPAAEHSTLVPIFTPQKTQGGEGHEGDHKYICVLQ